MTKTKERMQTKASHRETGARFFLRRHAKGVEVTLEGGHSSNYTNGNVHLSFRTKTKKNLKKMQKCCCQKRCKKRKEFAKGWQTNKDATRRDEFQWRNVARVRGANAADNAGKAVRRPRQCSEAAVAALLKTSTHIIPPAHVLPVPLATPRLAN